MAHLRIECAVARNRKFVAAGPAASWLWLCGLAYCQEGLTDGYIPKEAIPYLGVQNAAKLASSLVKVGLWETADGGWKVHDYLQHNRSASEITEIKEKRADGGKLGGRPKKNLTVNIPRNLPKTLEVSFSETLSETFPVDVDVDVVEPVVQKKKGEPPFFDGQAAFAQLCAAYPAARVNESHRVSALFLDVLGTSNEWPANFELMLANLETHKRSHEWLAKRMIPNLERWLSEGRWKRPMDADAPPVTRSNEPEWVRKARERKVAGVSE